MSKGRQRILAMAEELFTQHGYQAVSIRDIARASNLTNAALYYHFPNKEALYTEVLENHAARLSENLRQAGQGFDEPRQRLVAILTAFADETVKHRSTVFSMRRDAGPEVRQKLHHHMHRMLQAILDPIGEVIDEAVADGTLRPMPDDMSAAAALVGMLQGITMHDKAADKDSLTPEKVADIVDIFWYGLANQPEIIDKDLQTT